jgi:hypothetical protein
MDAHAVVAGRSDYLPVLVDQPGISGAHRRHVLGDSRCLALGRPQTLYRATR